MEEPDGTVLAELVGRLMIEDEHALYDVADQIARMGRPVLPCVMTLADDPRPRMRAMAAYILAHVGDLDPTGRYAERLYPDGVPVLVRLLESDPEGDVRAAAAAALGHHRAPETLPALCRAASDPSGDVRFDVAFALGCFYDEMWQSEAASSHRGAVHAALLRLMDDEDEDVRDWATFGIRQGGHDTPEVRARLWQALDDPCPDVRGEAAAGLAEFGDRSLIPRLDQLLREDPALPSNFFGAAEELGDPCLLPAVRAGAERWQQGREEGEELHYDITSAIEALEKAAAAKGNGNSASSETESRLDNDFSSDDLGNDPM